MANVLTIAGRELRGYFLPPFVWILAALLVACTGIMLAVQDMDLMLPAALSPILLFAPVVASVLTMRTLAQEYKLGTIEIVLTATSRAWEIVLGKFLAAWIGLTVLLLPIVWLVLLVMRYHNPGIAITASAFFTLLFLGAAFVGTGVLASSLTSHPFVAFALSMALLYGLWFAFTPLGVVGQSYVVGDMPGSGMGVPTMLFFAGVTALTLVLTLWIVSRRRR